MVDGDYMSLVKTRPVAQWRETLAVLATYTHAEQWAQLCDALAARLAQTGMHHAATLCYICAGGHTHVCGFRDQAQPSWQTREAASPLFLCVEHGTVLVTVLLVGLAP
jgi:protein transport protein SEC31